MTTLLLAAWAVAWTNTAGRVVQAVPVRLDGARIVLNCGAAGLRDLPLSAFPKSEQRRMRAALGVYELPAALKPLRAAFAAELTRAEQRHAGGALADEEFRSKCARVKAAWAEALGRSKLGRDEIEFWKGHLR